MTDEEVAVIEAACAVDRLLWPADRTAGLPTRDLDLAFTAMHEAVKRLEGARRPASAATNA